MRVKKIQVSPRIFTDYLSRRLTKLSDNICDETLGQVAVILVYGVA